MALTPAPAPRIISAITNSTFVNLPGSGVANAFVTLSPLSATPAANAAAFANQDGSVSAYFNFTGQGFYSYAATETAFTLTPSAPSVVSILVTAPNVAQTANIALSTTDISALFPNGFRFMMNGGTNYVSLADATYSVGMNTNEAQIQRLYEGLLGRAADPTGLAADDATLNAGGTITSVAGSLLASGEFATDHGNAPDAQFVINLYEGFLGRVPDYLSGAALTAALDSGAMTRAQAAVGLAGSAEAQNHLATTTDGIALPSNAAEVNDVYRTALGRNVDVGSAANISSALGAGVPLLSIIQGIVASPEYQADHTGMSNTALVGSFYQNALGRAPDPVGGPTDIAMLNGGVSQAQLILGISQSSEAASHLTVKLNTV